MALLYCMSGGAYLLCEKVVEAHDSSELRILLVNF